MDSTTYSRFTKNAESTPKTNKFPEPARNLDTEETPEKGSKNSDDESDNGLTPPKKGNYAYMDDSDEAEDFDYKDQPDDYYNDYGEGELDLEDEGEEACSADDEDEDKLADSNAIDQLKKVLLQVKSQEGKSPAKAWEKSDSKQSSKKKEKPVETPKPRKERQYREDEERAPFTPLCEIIDADVFDESDSSEDEGLPDYRIGGYHPVHVGEVFLDRYIIVQKLGWGHFSTVWLTKDLKFDTFVALKVQKSSQNYLEAAYDEVEILDVVSQRWKTEEWQKSLNHYYRSLHEEEKKKRLPSDCYCVQLLNSFLHYGPNGKHFVMVFEIMGVNLLEVIKRYDYKGVPLPLVRTLARQCLIGLDYLHRLCNIIHTDLKPENVLICLTEAEIVQIATENRLKSNKNQKNHLKRDRNVAEFALGKEFKNLKTGETPSAGLSAENQVANPQKQHRAGGLRPINPDEPLDYNNCEGFTPLTYAELLPEYTTANKNKKKKLRNKHQKELEEINQQKFEEFKQQRLGPKDFYQTKEEVDAKLNEETKEDMVAEVLTKNANLENEVSEDLRDPHNPAEPQEPKVSNKGPKIDENVELKICDLGNGCWTHHHFSSEIQTRQYRSPETIIGLNYGTSADIWSFACMIFELITGDFLFEPRKGHNFDKDDDHLAQMMEILGKMPKNMAFSGRLAKRFFDKTGHLLKIRGLQHWPLKKVLMEKYRFVESEAESLADFLLPMLEWYPEKRATAKEMLEHPWLNMPANYDYLLSERDYQVMMLKNKLTQEPSVEDNKEMSELGESDIDLFNADFEDNNSTMSDEDDDGEFFTVIDTKTIAKKDYYSEDEDIDTRLPGPNYLHNSFTGPYPEDMNRSYVDKGPNPQFINLDDI